MLLYRISDSDGSNEVVVHWDVSYSNLIYFGAVARFLPAP